MFLLTCLMLFNLHIHHVHDGYVLPGLIESVSQKLVDNFSKQTPSVQEVYYTRFMSLRAALYRCSPGAQQRAADCHSKQVLHCIASLLKSTLRPKTMSAQDLVRKDNCLNKCYVTFLWKHL